LGSNQRDVRKNRFTAENAESAEKKRRENKKE
jgi:hypothetical protein